MKICNPGIQPVLFMIPGLTSLPAFSAEAPVVPEPSLLSLLGIAGVIAIIAAIRKRR